MTNTKIYTTNNANVKLNAYNAFRDEHGNGENGFPTKELAVEYAKLYCDWWGSNLVFLGIQEKDRMFHPGFNVWD